jgi:Mg2+ and Co2+ transporters
MITVRHNTKTDGYIWVDARDVNREDLSVLTEEYGISSELLADIMDIDEQARIEKEDEYTALIMRLPAKSEDENDITQSCVPLGVILFPNQVITICQSDSVVLEDFAKQRFRQYPVDTKEGFVISILGRAALVYIRLLKYINRQKDLVEEQLHKSIMNYELIQLLSIQKSLVYFTTSLTTNEMLLEKLQKTALFRLNNDEEIEFLDDVITDNKQAIAMANIYTDILTGTMDGFASVIGNNMNIIMKRLTVISLALMFPTFITGFFGMNVQIPGDQWKWTWVVLAIVCVLVALLGAYFLSNKRSRMFLRTIGEEKKAKRRFKKKSKTI